MRKLMIALAAIVTAVAAHAATVNWTFAATLMDANFEPIEGSLSFYLSSDMNTALANSPFAVSAGEVSGTVSGTDQTSWTARITIDNFDGETKSYFYDYVFTMDTVSHAGYADADTYLAGLIGEVGTALTLDGALDLYASPASQGFTAVPEPTSGLLLILGMAGLALKRKRA